MLDYDPFVSVCLSYGNEFSPSEKHDQEYTLDNVFKAKECIQLLLRESEGHEITSGLRRDLNSASKKLQGERKIRRSKNALETISVSFENYLQVIAAIKYEHEESVLFGGNSHKGYFSSSLGELMRGNPKPKYQHSYQDVPSRSVIDFNEESGRLKDVILRNTESIRNNIHGAKKERASKIYENLYTVLSAYLAVTEDNFGLVINKLHPVSRRAHSIVSSLEEPEEYIESRVSVGDKVAKTNEFISTLRSRSESVFGLTGAPGSGKSTLSQVVYYREAKNLQREPLGDTWVPVLVEPADITHRRGLQDVVEKKIGELEEQTVETTEVLDFLIIVDGLDEIDSELLRSTFRDIRRITKENEGHKILVTSRKNNLASKISNINCRLLSFNDKDLYDYIQKKAVNKGSAQRIYSRLKENERLKEICKNPMMLYFLTEIAKEEYGIPDNKGVLIKNFIDSRLERDEDLLHPLSKEVALKMLSEISYKSKEEEPNSIDKVEAKNIVQDVIDSQHLDIGSISAIKSLVNTQIIRENKCFVEFEHKTYKDFLSSLRIRDEISNKKSLKDRYCREEKWHNSIVMLYGIPHGNIDLYNTLQKKDIGLLAKCVSRDFEKNTKEEQELLKDAKKRISSGKNSVESIDALSTLNQYDAFDNINDLLDTRGKLDDYIYQISQSPLSTAAKVISENNDFETFKSVYTVLKVIDDSKISEDKEGKRKLGESIAHVISKNESKDIDESKFDYLSLIARYAEPTDDVIDDVDSLVHRKISRGNAVSFYRFCERFGIPLSDKVGARVLARSIKQGVDPDNVPLLRDKSFRGRTIAELYHYALIYERPAWLAELENSVAQFSDYTSEASMDAFAQAIFDQSKKRHHPSAQKALVGLRALGGMERTQHMLREFLASRRVPIASAYQTAIAADAQGVFTEIREEYIRRANQARADFKQDVRAEFCRWSTKGEVDPSLLKDYVGDVLHSDKYAFALAAVYATGMDISETRYNATISDIQSKCCSKEDNTPWVCKEWILFELCWSLFREKDKRDAIELYLSRESADPHKWCSEAKSFLKNYLVENIGLNKDCIVKNSSEILNDEDIVYKIAKKSSDYVSEEKPEDLVGLISRWKKAGNVRNLDLILDNEEKYFVSNQFYEYIEGGNYERAEELVKTLPDLLGDEVELEDKEGFPDSLVKAMYEAEIVGEEFLEEWLVEKIKGGDIDKIGHVIGLGEHKSVKDMVIIPTMRKIENGDFVDAAKLIGWFGLEDEFKSELSTICENIIDSDDGHRHIKKISSKLGPSSNIKIGKRLLDRCKEGIRNGDFKLSYDLIFNTGYEYLKDDVVEWIHDIFGKLDKNLKSKALQSPKFISFLDDEVAKEKMIKYDVPVKCRVKEGSIHYDKGFCFLREENTRTDVFLHANDYPGSFQRDIEPGKQLYLAIEQNPKGCAADYVFENGGDDLNSPDSSSTQIQQEETTIEDLADKWDAEISDHG